jgi:hypothetical protein
VPLILERRAFLSTTTGAACTWVNTSFLPRKTLLSWSTARKLCINTCMHYLLTAMYSVCASRLRTGAHSWRGGICTWPRYAVTTVPALPTGKLEEPRRIPWPRYVAPKAPNRELFPLHCRIVLLKLSYQLLNTRPSRISSQRLHTHRPLYVWARTSPRCHWRQHRRRSTSGAYGPARPNTTTLFSWKCT